MNPDGCFNRVLTNESDFTNAVYPLQEMPSHIRTMLPMFAEKAEFITGYNRSEGEQRARDSATVFTNSDLLHADVYMWAAALFFLLIGFIVTRVFLQFSLRNWTLRRLMKDSLTVIRREMSRVFYYSSDHFKLVTLLYAPLIFPLTTTFLCLFKTSHIVIERPFYPETYFQSLNHRTSLAFFYDQFHPVSSSFREAPRSSIKGQLWNKMIESDRKDLFDFSSYDSAAVLLKLRHGAVDLMVNKSIYFAASLIMPSLKTFFCTFSPEDQLYFIRKMADHDEAESIYGSLIPRALSQGHLIEQRFTRTFESNFLPHHMETLNDPSGILNPLMGTSESHSLRQKVACEDEDAFNPESQVKAIPLFYFKSFFAACAVVWVIAIIFNCIENARE